jgi:hypothetical protein
MPLYYFDVREGDNLNRDTDGLDLPSIKEAREQASMALSTMLHDALPDGLHMDISIEVRGADSRALFKVHITFDVEGDEAPPREGPQLRGPSR